MVRASAVEDGGLAFWCPGCDEAHVVTDNWTISGDLELPTISPSIKVTAVQWDVEKYPYFARRAGRHPDVEVGDQTVCHSFVENGQIRFLDDCTHILKGATVDLPEWSL